MKAHDEATAAEGSWKRLKLRADTEAEADGGAAAAPPPSFCPSFVRMPARADEVAYLFDVADSSGKSRATWPVQYRAITPNQTPTLVFTARTLFNTARCKFDCVSKINLEAPPRQSNGGLTSAVLWLPQASR